MINTVAVYGRSSLVFWRLRAYASWCYLLCGASLRTVSSNHLGLEVRKLLSGVLPWRWRQFISRKRYLYSATRRHIPKQMFARISVPLVRLCFQNLIKFCKRSLCEIWGCRSVDCEYYNRTNVLLPSSYYGIRRLCWCPENRGRNFLRKLCTSYKALFCCIKLTDILNSCVLFVALIENRRECCECLEGISFMNIYWFWGFPTLCCLGWLTATFRNSFSSIFTGQL